MFLEGDQSGACSKAVPCGAVVAQLEVLGQGLGEDERGQDPAVAGHRLHRETTGGPAGQAHVPEGPHLERARERKRKSMSSVS